MKTMKTPVLHVPLEDARKWIHNWQMQEKIKGTQIICHLLPSIDVYEIFKIENGTERFRGYNAINDEGEYKFLMVGVDPDGNDMVDPDRRWYIYDMTTPCPSACSANKWWEETI